MSKVYDHITIGAGASGMAMSCLLQRQNSNNLVLEAHHFLGGSASFYYRNGYCFDVGATTLSGIKHNGPLKHFLEKTNIELPLIEIDPGIISIINQKQIKHHANYLATIEQFKKAFPNISGKSIHDFYDKLNQINSLAYHIISKNNLPLRSPFQSLELLKPSNLKAIELLPLLNKSFANYLPEEFNASEELKKVIDEVLFITAQNNAQNTPALFGILGLMYPTDTYYLNGGMKTLFDILKKHSGEIKINQKVISIEKKNSHYIVQTNKETFLAKSIISTLPEKNLDLILKKEVKQSSETWSAFTLYFTVPNKIKTESLYYQMHVKNIPIANTKSYFASFSHPNDHQRNFNQRRTVSISTHIMPSVFNKLNSEEYQKQKEQLGEYIIQNFIEYFQLERHEIENLELGTSKTFEHYTNRYQGSVGGYGHHLNQNLLDKIYQSEIDKNFYSIGDTTFPGQGIAAVIYGAMSLESFLYR